jgi:sodium-dependent dicarboxylate transporter 2/3/5
MKKEQSNYAFIATGFIAAGATVFATGGTNLYWNAIALCGLMVFLWLTEALPIYVTALFPFVFGIPLGILDNNQLAASYGNTNVYLFMGGFMLALALEKHNVHKQIAKRIIKIVGNSKARLLLGFILSTGLLSMWISNTATALMMLPMGLAIIASMPEAERTSKFSLFLLLSIAYSASVGGMATLVGSPPNLLMASILNEAPYNVAIDFLQWMKIGLPLSMIMLFVVYLVFYLFMGKERNERLVINSLEIKPWNTTQMRVLGVFFLVVILWSFKIPITELTGIVYDDYVPAILGSLLLFLVPTKKEGMLLAWKDTKNLPWGILLLFGGGLALAEMLRANGVITQLSDLFVAYKEISAILVLFVIVTVAIFGTELMSNLALINVFVPVIAQFALQSDYSIIQLCVPVTLAASCAFMLPVGTPPNAIVFSSGAIHMKDMARYGFVLNVAAVFIIVLAASLFF